MKHPKSYDSTAETRKRMSHVKLKKGYEEVVLAKALWHKGYRYRLNYKGLPGSPDIAIIKYKVAIFVDGEFWHGYKWDEKKDKIKRNREYWIQKIEENMARDSRVDEELKAIEKEVDAEIEKACEFAAESPYPDASELMTDIFVD